MPSRLVVLDDRLLIEELLVGLGDVAKRKELCTTAYWFYRACRAATLGAGGYLSGPFEDVPAEEQQLAILSLLELRDDIALPNPRTTVPAMAQLAIRHERLNLLNLEAAAFASTARATVWMSAATAAGVLPAVLDAERIPWLVVDVA
jgi:hypothetical protein